MRNRSGALESSWAVETVRWLLLTTLVILLSAPAAAAGKEFCGLARVQDDGTLRIAGQQVRLFGIYIPPTNRICRTFIRPVRCRARAVSALEFRIRGFVRCQRKQRFRDGSISAVCFTSGRGSILSPEIDLAAYLLSNGWTVALPGGPFSYVTLERIARSNGRGIWGFQADQIR